jgi:catechol 2,3-dioxygenase-like lactoylglutathione lyase family enzyme
MIDHTGINVSHFERSKEFYTQSLASLGYRLGSPDADNFEHEVD